MKKNFANALILLVVIFCLECTKVNAAELGFPVGRFEEIDFDYISYAKNNPDLAELYGDDKEALWEHWCSVGRDEGRYVSTPRNYWIKLSNFDYKRYANDYPDVAELLGMNPEKLLRHYKEIGALEGRCAYATDEYTNGILEAYDQAQRLTIGMSNDFDKIRAVYDWIVYNCDYDYTYSKNGVADVMNTHEGVCGAYAKTFKCMMDSLKIECQYISGTAFNGLITDGHAWDRVKVNGSWYYIDVTWDIDKDNLYTLVEPMQFVSFDLETGRSTWKEAVWEPASYDYFMISEQQMNINHMPDYYSDKV